MEFVWVEERRKSLSTEGEAWAGVQMLSGYDRKTEKGTECVIRASWASLKGLDIML